MRNDFMKTLLIAVAGLLPGVCLAQPTVGDLSKIQGETLILKAKVSREAAQAELDSRSRAAGGYTPSDDTHLPVVKSVYGARNMLVATLIYPNGTTMEAKVGDTLNGGYKVSKIVVDRVELTKNKKVVQLGFSAMPPTATAMPGPAMPGISQPYAPPLGR